MSSSDVVCDPGARVRCSLNELLAGTRSRPRWNEELVSKVGDAVKDLIQVGLGAFVAASVEQPCDRSSRSDGISITRQEAMADELSSGTVFRTCPGCVHR